MKFRFCEHSRAGDFMHARLPRKKSPPLSRRAIKGDYEKEEKKNEKVDIISIGGSC
jgi:hypothetical protein